MQLEVLQKKENPLLKRVEIAFKAIHKAEPTPTRDALRAFLAKELKATKDIVVIDSQASTFGRYETLGYAKVYRSKDEALAVERKHILVRNKLIEAEVKEKAGAPAKAEKPVAPTPKPEKPTPVARAEKPAAAPTAEAPKPAAKPEAKPEKGPPKEERKPAKEEKKPEKKEEKKEEKAEPKAEKKPPAKKEKGK